MTTYNRNDRKRLRYRLRRWQRLINYLLAALVLLALLQPAVASAAPACPGGRATPRGCHYVWRGLDCYWQPGRLAVCIAPLGVQP